VIKVKLLAKARFYNEQKGVYLIIKIQDMDGKNKIVRINAADALSMKHVQTVLIDHGFPPPVTKDGWHKIHDIVMGDTPVRAIIVRRPGFVKTSYMLQDESIIGPIGEIGPFLDPEHNLSLTIMDQKGSLHDWKNEVAVYASYSSRIMLAISSAFSGYLLRWSEIESGGFHYYGDSSIGKSTSLYVANSVKGSRDCLGTWSVTKAAIEEHMGGSNDSLVTMDELFALDENPVKAAQLAGNIFYTISLGKGKKRSKKYQYSELTWSVCVLSTGELSLAEHARGGDIKRMLGSEVRFVDVPADANNGFGIFESLPDNIKSPDRLAKLLDKNTKKYYGTAQKAFLEKLTEDLAQDTKQVTNKINRDIKYFIEKNNVNRNIGYQIRMAERFALAYAAGCSAVKYKVLPFKTKQIFKEISKCYMDAVNARPEMFEERLEYASKKLRKLLVSGNFIDIRDKNHGFSCDDIKSADGVKTTFDGEKARAIFTKTLTRLISDKTILKRVLYEYKIAGRLICYKDGKKTKQISTGIQSCKPRAYYFRPSTKKNK
tara:strand:- start:1829 stop:3460 length:1632 start_codon:yes stop_codon:yes gene_type:complete